MRTGFVASLALLPALCDAYWLMSAGTILTSRVDPIVSAGQVPSAHVHSIVGGSNFAPALTTKKLQQSSCTSTAVDEDFSNYWFPKLYFQWKNGSFSGVSGGTVLYYFFPDTPGEVKAFPPDFRMVSGNPFFRTMDTNSVAQKSTFFKCIQSAGNGANSDSYELPAKKCTFSLRSQVFFPHCWDGKNLDSADHKSHVSFGAFSDAFAPPGSGSKCTDSKFPVRLPRLLLEVYWDTVHWDVYRDQAKNTAQPYVFAYGDPTGYGNHADFFNGWKDGVLQKAIDGCNCNIYGDPSCCVDKGIFSITKNKPACTAVDPNNERVTGMVYKLPGNNPVVGAGGTVNKRQIPAAQLTMDDTTTTPEAIPVEFGAVPNAPDASTSTATAAPSANCDTTSPSRGYHRGQCSKKPTTRNYAKRHAAHAARMIEQHTF